MDLAFLVIAWFPTIAACAGLCALVARLKGRGMLPWALAGYVLGPIALAWVLPVRRSSKPKRKIVDVRAVQNDSAEQERVMLHPQAHQGRLKGKRAA